MSESAKLEGRAVRRLTLRRGILPPLLEEWDRRAAAYEALLDRLGADEDTYTIELILNHVPITSPAAFRDRLAEQTASHSEGWIHFTLGTGANQYGTALPVSNSLPPQSAALALYVEIHSRLVAWWLTYAWRSQQLAKATAALASSDQVIPAASCARALLETAAAFWADTRTIADIWHDAKSHGKPVLADRAMLRLRQRFIAQLTEMQFGGKWTDKTPEAKEVFGRYTRGNVQSAIDKLAKRYPGDLQTDYAWLCNTVHPSLGTALVFAAPPLLHETGTHVQRWLAGVPLSIQADGVDEEFAERSVPSATGRATVAALEVLTATMAAAIEVVDDIALTTGAPGLADFEYWRALRTPDRNEPCPCGSGKKSKKCGHVWGLPAPRVPQTFIQS